MGTNAIGWRTDFQGGQRIMALDSEAIDDAWERYRLSRSLDERNQLVTHYGALATRVCKQLLRRSSLRPGDRETSAEDLAAFAAIGLIDAVERFDPLRGTKFEPYAVARIHGSVIDALRAADWVPRKIRDHDKAVVRATATLEQRLGRPPTLSEVAEHLGLAVETLGPPVPQGLASLDSMADKFEVWAPGQELGDSSVAGAMLDASGSPEDYAGIEAMRSQMSAALAALAPRARTVLALVYIEELSFERVGELLGIGKTRSCQLHAEAIVAFRQHLAGVDLDAFLSR